MIQARQLAAFLLLAPIAAAQNTTSGPAEVTGINISEQETGVRIALDTTAPVPSAEVIATYRDSLTLDLPGAVYRGLPRRIPVNRAGVRAVRLWMQSEDPPLTRVVVETEKTEQYLLSSGGNSVVLQVGPALQSASASTTPNAAEVWGARRAPRAGQGAASATVAGALVGIFRRGPGKPAVSTNPKVQNEQPVPQADSAAQAAQSLEPAQNPAQSSAETTSAAVKSPDQPATASLPQPAASPATAAAGPSTPVSAGQGSASATVAGALAGIFRRGPGKPALSNNSKIQNGQPVPQADSAAQAAQSLEPAQNPTQSSAETTSATVKSPDQPALASSSTTAGSEAVSTPAPSDAPSASMAPSSGENSGSASSTVPAAPAEAPVEATADATPEPARVGGRPITAQNMIALAAVANPGMRTEFQVKYVDQDIAYLDGGRSSGLTEGMKLIVKDKKPTAVTSGSANLDGVVAELVVVGVAETSAITEIHTPKRDVVSGDLAYLSSQDLQALVQQHALGATRKYPAVITFSEGGDALDEEARAFVPRPSLPSVNRASARIGLDYSGTKSNDASQASSSSIGGVIRADITRIGGTYWNFRGYWRGRLSSTSATSQQTLQDLINRTYHLALTYENPSSRWVLGVGRLYLPWATSLDTLDGGYFAARVRHGVTTGIFGGSTPDPTSWNYSPNRHMGGAFLNAEAGSFEAVRYSSTAGFGKSFETVQYSTSTSTGTTTASYQDNRPFAFFENSISYKRTFSIFHALQADQPSANPAAASPGAGISRSFLTMRVQPFSRIEFSANHTYFRDIPTFDPQLVGTGLLDKYLFQGFSGGVRVEVVKNVIALYSDLGRSSRTGDAKTSLNQMYGITFLKIPKVGLRADAHYSRFTSSFGSGIYRSFSLSRNWAEGFRVELLGGDQSFTSSLAGNQSAKFLTTNLDTSLGSLFFLQGGFTVYRGQLQNYNQWNLTLGYRFDNKWKRK
jgi:hypothetical protein